GKPRWPLDPNAGRDRELEARVRALAAPKLSVALATPEKQERAGAVSRVFDEVWAALALDESKRDHARAAFEAIEAAEVRRLIVEKGLRLDGRKLNEIRPITIEVGYLPRAPGSSNERGRRTLARLHASATGRDGPRDQGRPRPSASTACRGGKATRRGPTTRGAEEKGRTTAPLQGKRRCTAPPSRTAPP